MSTLRQHWILFLIVFYIGYNIAFLMPVLPHLGHMAAAAKRAKGGGGGNANAESSYDTSTG